MKRRTVGVVILGALLLSLGFLGPDITARGQDCGGYSTPYFGEGVIQVSPYYGGCSGGNYSGQGCSGGYQAMRSYWSAPVYSTPMYATPVYVPQSYGYGVPGMYSYRARYETPYVAMRQRGRWVCGGSGCYWVE